MARFTQLLLSGGFASAMTRYTDHYPGDEKLARIVVPLRLQNVRYQVLAVVDTGTPWCILDPEIAERVHVSQRAEFLFEDTLRIRGDKFHGKLFRMGMSLQIEQGQGFEVDATVFVPILLAGQLWPYPNFLGLDGFLERIRFAVDPEERAFYFGPTGWGSAED